MQKVQNFSFAKIRKKLHIDIWKFIGFWKGPKRQIVSLLGVILLFRLGFDSWSQTILLVLSMLLHEAGHGVVLLLSNIKYKIYVLFPLGAVVAPINEEENEKSDNLPGNILSWFTQTGPMVNVILIGAGALMERGSGPISQIGHDLIYVNVLLASFNILPVWKLDSGQTLHIIYSSLKEKGDSLLKWGLVALGGAILAGILIQPRWEESVLSAIRNIHWVAFLLVFLFGVVRKSYKDDVHYPESGNAMKTKHIVVHLCVYFLMVMVVFGYGFPKIFNDLFY